MALSLTLKRRCLPIVVFSVTLVSALNGSAQPNEPLVITEQPRSQFVATSETLTLSVKVSGTPASYQWYQNGSRIQNAIKSTYSVTPSVAKTGGDYWVVVTNQLSSVTSAVATVTMLPDTVGPHVLSATGDTNVLAFRGVQAISIAFSEVLSQSISTNAANFAVYAGNDYSTPVAFTNVTYIFPDHPRILLSMSDEHWVLGGNYFVVINGVADRAGNNIFPNTRVGVAWAALTNLIPLSASWEYHAAQAFDPGIYETDPAWYDPSYSTASSPWWQTGVGVFSSSTGASILCTNAPPGSQIVYQRSPTLFRHTFVQPEGLGTSTNLQIAHLAGDGLVGYLNGKQVYQLNVNPGPVNSNSFAQYRLLVDCPITSPLAATLVPGTNTLAVALLRSIFTDTNITLFGLELIETYYRVSPVPPEPPPNQAVLNMNRQGNVLQFSWSTNLSGYGLQYKSNLDQTLPWLSVSNQSNPFNTTLDGATRLYRLYRNQ